MKPAPTREMIQVAMKRFLEKGGVIRQLPPSPNFILDDLDATSAWLDLDYVMLVNNEAMPIWSKREF